MQNHRGAWQVVSRVALIALVVAMLPNVGVQAATSQQKMTELQKQQAELNKQIQADQAAANAKKKEASGISSQIEDLTTNIDSTQGKIDDLNGKISSTNVRISELETQIAAQVAELDIQQRNQDETLRVMYETSTDDLLFMIVGSSSISDVIDHNQYLSALEDQIDATLTEILELKEQLEKNRSDMEAQKIELTGFKAQEEAYQAGLSSEKAQKDALLNQTVQQQKSLEKEVAEAKKLNAQVEAELSKIRATLSRGSGPGVTQARDRGTSSVGFQWPTDYRYISTYFGGSTPFQPGGGHGGLDLVNGSGTPIYAAADGTVTTVTEMRLNGNFYAYGRYVVIGHNAKWSTLYGHLQSFAVSSGQEVKRGQIIGYMGSTGWSTGPHLHFEIWDYSSRVNPMSYLP
ncbi:MAG: peptidoglycan DD-metalloendopeptidase family protein [Patescibacteria group bacterium]